MAISRDVARVNFAHFVKRALKAARGRKLGDAQIKELTGVGASTFHRWARGEWGRDWPEVQKVIDFCTGLDIPTGDAFDALGISGQRRSTEAAPLDPDVKIILRRLASPDASEAERATIRATLKYLADLADRTERGEGQDRRAS